MHAHAEAKAKALSHGQGKLQIVGADFFFCRGLTTYFITMQMLQNRIKELEDDNRQLRNHMLEQKIKSEVGVNMLKEANMMLL